jgi:hypothetical protein
MHQGVFMNFTPAYFCVYAICLRYKQQFAVSSENSGATVGIKTELNA